MSHGNGQLNDSVRNTMAAIITVIVIWFLSTYSVPGTVEMIFIHELIEPGNYLYCFTSQGELKDVYKHLSPLCSVSTAVS